MNFINAFWTALGVMPEERGVVRLLLANSFFFGLAYVLFDTPAHALFLVEYDSNTLAYVYILMAIMVPLAGLLFAQIGSYVASPQLFRGTALFLAGSATVYYAAWVVGDLQGISLFLMAWSLVVWTLGSLQLWEAAGYLLDLQQAKRLFAPIWSGMMVGIIAGSLTIPFLVSWFGTPSLLLGAALSFMATFSLLALRLPKRSFPQKTRQTRSANNTWQALLKKPYVRIIFSFQIGLICAYYLLEFIFVNRVQIRYTDADQFAAFFGGYRGVATFFMIAASTLIGGRIISTYGLRVGLRFHAFVLAITLSTAALVGLTMGLHHTFFWVLVIAKLAEDVFAGSVTDPAQQILYQPLRHEDRIHVRVAVESVVGSLALGIIGVLLVVLEQIGFIAPLFLVGLVLGVYIALLFIGTRLFTNYKDTLSSTLNQRLLSETEILSTPDATGIKLLQQKLSSHLSAEVIYALQTLEHIDSALIVQALPDLLYHPDHAVRAEAVARVEEFKPHHLLPLIEERLHHEQHPRVQEQILKARIALIGEEALEDLTPYLEVADPEMQRSAIVGFIKHGGIAGILFAGSKLMALAKSSDPQDRRLAAHVLGEIQVAHFYQPLIPLLKDPDVRVREEAIWAAGQLHHPTLWGLVVQNLSTARLRPAVTFALLNGGEITLPELEKFSKVADVQAQVRIAQLYGRIGGMSAIQKLIAMLDLPNATLVKMALLSLSSLNYSNPHDETIQRHLDTQLKLGFWLQSILPYKGDKALENALMYEWGEMQKRLLLLLSFLYNSAVILRVYHTLAQDPTARRAFAIEALDVQLPQELKMQVIPMLALAPPPGVTRRLLTPEALVQEIIKHPLLSAWTKSCAIYLLRNVSDETLVEYLSPVRDNTDALIQDTAAGMVAQRMWTPTLAPLQKFKPKAQGDIMLLLLEKVIILKTVQIFSEVPEDLLVVIATHFVEATAHADEIIVQKGETGDCMYIIIDGRVKIHDGDKVYALRGARDFFGEMALLDSEPRSATVTALSEAHLLKLDQDIFYELLADYPDVLRAIMRVLVKRLRDLMQNAILAD